jgi:hypothetical protein
MVLPCGRKRRRNRRAQFARRFELNAEAVFGKGSSRQPQNGGPCSTPPSGFSTTASIVEDAFPSSRLFTKRKASFRSCMAFCAIARKPSRAPSLTSWTRSSAQVCRGCHNSGKRFARACQSKWSKGSFSRTASGERDAEGCDSVTERLSQRGRC